MITGQNRYTIVTTEQPYARIAERWVACFTDFDLDCDQGSGLTELQAITDLLENHDLPKGEVK